MRNFLSAILLVSFLLAGMVSMGQSSKPKKLEVGQIWKYETRETEKKSRLIILKIEAGVDGTKIVHIAVEKLKIEGGKERIAHLPFVRKNLEECLVKLVSSNNDLPDFKEGYAKWSEAYASGQAGLWKFPVAIAIASIEESLKPALTN